MAASAGFDLLEQLLQISFRKVNHQQAGSFHDDEPNTLLPENCAAFLIDLLGVRVDLVPKTLQQNIGSTS
jgi:hypothetical protein